MSDNSVYEYWLSNLAGIGIKKQKFMREYAGAEQLFNMSPDEISMIKGLSSKDIRTICINRDFDRICREYEELGSDGISFLGISDSRYPDKLRNIYDAPTGLYYKGDLNKLDNSRKIVAIVGSRGCTSYGVTMAKNIAGSLSAAGVAVISGMARGIDTYAHEGCLNGPSPTFAVLAGGVDVCYPKENIDLYCRICEMGGIFSEFPPGTLPKPQLFPVRNRIISGIADAVVVVEARLRSGSLITADMALEQNRNVYVVPGRIGDPLSEGCLWLAKQGAQVLTEVNDILRELGIEPCNNTREENFKITLAPHEKMLYSLMCLFPKNLNTLIEESGLEPQQAMTALLSLELKGLIREVGCHYYSKK
ncbi:MAG: DNA-processing protein DprA [Lachnospiraceae bacterium]